MFLFAVLSSSNYWGRCGAHLTHVKHIKHAYTLINASVVSPLVSDRFRLLHGAPLSPPASLWTFMGLPGTFFQNRL